ncbi:hypothetical protein SCFA_20016 [anaerobic digester metagenome]|uniref:Uncharacterized protein n=1 Tax=anaerobic digester metagenome TaxID=1263854 RepID=A0A485LXE0_9ZZZZ
MRTEREFERFGTDGRIEDNPVFETARVMYLYGVSLFYRCVHNQTSCCGGHSYKNNR